MWHKYWYLTDRALKLGLLLPKLQRREFSRYFRAKYLILYFEFALSSEQRKFLYGSAGVGIPSGTICCSWLLANAYFFY